MRTLFGVLSLLVGIWLGLFIAAGVLAQYHYSKEIGSFWDLSVKASTIQQKSAYLDRFVDALDHAGLAKHDALWLRTPDNSSEQNMYALRSLQGRMHEIIGMDPSSFQYQTALQQITAQEQGEANQMLGTLEGAWYLQNHFFLWGWVGILHFCVIFISSLVLWVATIIIWLDS